MRQERLDNFHKESGYLATRPAWLRYVVAMVFVGVAIAVRVVFLHTLGLRNFYLTFYPAVIITALYGGLAAGLFAAILSALSADYVLIEPVGSFYIKDPSDIWGMAVFIISCTMIIFITEAMHRARARAGKAETQAKLAAEQIKAEEALREREKRLGLFIEHAPVALAMFDREMRYISVSRRWMRDYGLGDRDLQGLSHYEIFPEIPARWKTIHRQALAGEVFVADDDRFERADGSVQWLRWEVHPWHNAAGDVAGIVIFSEDITERKRAEEERKEAYKELEGFAYTVAHDLRAPLRHMTSFAEMLKKRMKGKLDEQALHYTDVISEESKRMGMLVDDLLEFTSMKRINKQLEKVNLNSLVREAVAYLGDEVKVRDIRWEIDELPEVECDQSMLKLVLVNLISNAVKFTQTRRPAEIKIWCKEDKDEVVFSIKDNGAGFDMEYADKLFNVFQRLHHHDEFEGTGIGLANVRRIISSHGGRTWAEGSVGQGATFYFTLPKTKEK